MFSPGRIRTPYRSACVLVIIPTTQICYGRSVSLSNTSTLANKVFRALKINIVVLWIMTPCSLVRVSTKQIASTGCEYEVWAMTPCSLVVTGGNMKSVFGLWRRAVW